MAAGFKKKSMRSDEEIERLPFPDDCSGGQAVTHRNLYLENRILKKTF